MPGPVNKVSAQRLKIINKKARRDYFIVEALEAGIELAGTEVKSVREGQIDLSAGFADIEGAEVMLRDVHIKPYAYGHQMNHEPRRARRLLLHRREIRRLAGELDQKGMTLIPLSVYLNARGLIKVELGLCRGRRSFDKRDDLRRKADEREATRAVSDRARRH